MDALENGDVPTVLLKLTTPVLRSIVNIIGNVLNNSEFTISPTQKRVLRPYVSSYLFLLDKKESSEAKKQLLQETGEAFLPTFLDIVGDDITLFTERNRKQCPVCGKEDLIKLSNHLKQKHNITGDERKHLLKTSNTEQKNGFNSTDDKGDSHSNAGDT